jgi:hypothetical protein
MSTDWDNQGSRNQRFTSFSQLRIRRSFFIQRPVNLCHNLGREVSNIILLLAA